MEEVKDVNIDAKITGGDGSGERKMSLVQIFYMLATVKMQEWISKEDVEKWWSWSIFPKAAV